MNSKFADLRYVLPLLLVVVAAAAFLWPREQEAAPAGQRSARPVAQAPLAHSPSAQTPVSVQPVAMQTMPTRSISFDDLAFEVEADQPFEPSLLTPQIEAFNGTPISIRGYMLPTYRADGIEEFVLVRDDQVCCFGPGAKICHNMQVYMVDGASASYTTRVVEVEGTFKLENWTGDDGVVYSCYRIDAVRVRHL